MKTPVKKNTGGAPKHDEPENLTDLSKEELIRRLTAVQPQQGEDPVKRALYLRDLADGKLKHDDGKPQLCMCMFASKSPPEPCTYKARVESPTKGPDGNPLLVCKKHLKALEKGTTLVQEEYRTPDNSPAKGQGPNTIGSCMCKLRKDGSPCKGKGRHDSPHVQLEDGSPAKVCYRHSKNEFELQDQYKSAADVKLPFTSVTEVDTKTGSATQTRNAVNDILPVCNVVELYLNAVLTEVTAVNQVLQELKDSCDHFNLTSESAKVAKMAERFADLRLPADDD